MWKTQVSTKLALSSSRLSLRSDVSLSAALKQGDPLSPFLFILIMESLHLSFKNVENAGIYKGIPIDNSLTLTHLFYADDVVFVGKWDTSNINTIVNVLKCFFLASGLKINLHKSKLMGIGIPHNEVVLAADSIGCLTFSAPFKFLGVKVGGIMSRRGSWDDVIDKLSSRLSKWKLKTLSIGGRFTLIKSVLSSLPLYHLSIFKCPMGVLKLLESIRRNFFNGVPKSEKKLALIGWNKVMASKKMEGLAIHGPKGLLDNSRIPSRCSPWLDIVREFKSLVSKGINLFSFIKKVGNGEDTSFWDDQWINDSPLKILYPRLFLLELNKQVTVADKLREPSLTSTFRRAPRGGLEEEQLRQLEASLGHILLSQANDRWVWNLESSGEFSVKSTRIFIDNALLPKLDAPTRWIKVVPIKINIFAWRVCLDKLPTRLNLSLRGVDIPSILCPLCSTAVESSSHLLFSCHLARQLMFKVVRWWEIELHVLNSYEDWLTWFNNIRLSKRLKEILEGTCYVMWWTIWNFRNQVLFGIKQPRMELLFDDIVRLSFYWCSNRCNLNFDWNSWMKCPSSMTL
ncbi:RNA-directed DNA polymerase, eukaryota, reverse transcriptase zinc-binding domain protein [Tanacetum coccineum]